MFESKSYTRIVADIINRLASTTNVSSVEPGTVLRQIIDAQQLQLYDLQRVVQLLASQTFLTEQSGPFLDTIASLFGIQRRGQTTVSQVGGVRFYTKDATQLVRHINENFFVDNEVVVYDRYGGSYVVQRQPIPSYMLNYSYVTVNQTPVTVASGQLERGDIVSYTPVISNVAVTNISPVRLIHPPETDAELRYRIQEHLNSYRQATSQQLRLQQMTVPGVQDQRIVEFPRGVGSVDVYVLGIDINSDDQLIEPVRQAVSALVQAGIDLDVKTFKKTYVVLGGIVRAESQISRSVLLDAMHSAARNYIDAIPPGGALNKYALLGQIIRESGLQTIDSFTVYLKSPAVMAVSKPLVQDTYHCLENEKLLLHPTDWQVFQLL